MESITVYSDYVCPFCYLGRLSLAAYRSQRSDPLSVEWKPFDLRAQKRRPDGTIDHNVDDGKDEEYFDQVRENVAQLQEQYDADGMLDLDELPDEVDSLNAQLVSFWIQRDQPEDWPAFDEGVFEALWLDGRDIGAPDVLADIADGVGIERDAVHEALEDEALRATVEDQFEAARHDGVTGVPTFLYNDHAARGAVPPAQLERLVEVV